MGSSLHAMHLGLAPKKKARRTRKPSGKPGAEHISKLMAAHGAGDLKSAKSHALNYAKAIHGAMGQPAGEADAMQAPEPALPVKAPSIVSAGMPGAKPPGASMARMAMMKRKKP